MKISGAWGLCLYLPERLSRSAGVRRVTVEPSLLQQKYGNMTNGRMFLLYFMVTKFVSYFQRMPPKILSNLDGMYWMPLKQTRIWKTCGAALTPRCLLGYSWISLLVLICSWQDFVTQVSIRMDAVLLSISTFVLLEGISFSNWNGPFSAAKLLLLASFEPPKALVHYIVSLFWGLSERKRRKWEVRISLVFRA